MIDTSDLGVQKKLADYIRDERLNKVNELQEKELFEYKETFYSKYIKRVLDLLISLPAFIITFPINFVLGILTLVFLGRPVFFSQKRVGKNGKVFNLIKFRNMTNETDENGNLLPAQQRLTKFGKVIRKLSLDELLNFWSVLKGDMSIIGPRALPIDYYERYSDKHSLRLKVRPGLECPPREPIDYERTWNEQFDNDCWYVQNISFKTDCIMLVRLVEFTLNRKNAKMRAQCEKGSFIGYSWDGKAISNLDIDDDTVVKILNSSGDETYVTIH